MRIGPWGVVYATISLLCLGFIGYSTYRVRTLEGSASWIQERLRSQATDYEATLQSRYVDEEMQSFRERHQLLAESSSWAEIRLGLLMAWVLSSFAFYIHRVISRFAEEVTDGPQASPASRAPVR